MKKIVLECVNFYGDNWRETIQIPDDMVFVKTNDFFNEKTGKHEQRFYSAFYPYDEKMFNRMKKSSDSFRFSVSKICNEWIFAEIWNAYPVNEDIHEITIDEFNERYKDEIGKYVFSHKMMKRSITNKLIEHMRGNIKDDTNANEILDLWEDEKERYDNLTEDDLMLTTTMSKVLRFKTGGEHLYVEVAKVSFNSWIDENDVKLFAVNCDEFHDLLPKSIGGDKYIASLEQKEWDKFNNRVKEILTYCCL